MPLPTTHRESNQIGGIPPIQRGNQRAEQGEVSAKQRAFKDTAKRDQSHWEYLDEVVPVRREDVLGQQRSIVSRVLVLAQLVLSLGRDEEAHGSVRVRALRMLLRGFSRCRQCCKSESSKGKLLSAFCPAD